MNYISEATLFIKRLDASPKPTVHLTHEKTRAINQFLERLEAGYYIETTRPCLCEADNDLLIAQRDRYGIPLNTKLCRACGLMRSDPCLSPESIERFYRDDYRVIYAVGGGAAQVFAGEQKFGQRIHRWLNEQELASPATVFEIGCGAGGILAHFKRRGSRVVGCDYGDEYVQFGRSMGVPLEIGGVESLVRHGRADLVILCHVIEHFRDPIAELQRLKDVLKPDGLVYVEVPGILSIRATYGDVALFLQNAHVWHFCLATLDYVMSLARFERVAGNEMIQAVYRLAPMREPFWPRSETYRDILVSLRHAELLRYWPRFKGTNRRIKRLARMVLGESLYGAAKLRWRFFRRMYQG